MANEHIDKRTTSQFIPSNKDTAKFLENSVLGPMAGPSERRRRRVEGKNIEKELRKEGE